MSRPIWPRLKCFVLGHGPIYRSLSGTFVFCLGCRTTLAVDYDQIKEAS